MLCNSLDILQKIVLALNYVDLFTSKKLFGLIAFSPLSTKSHGSTMAPAMAPDGSQWRPIRPVVQNVAPDIVGQIREPYLGIAWPITMAPAMAPRGSAWRRPGLARAGRHDDMLTASALEIESRCNETFFCRRKFIRFFCRREIPVPKKDFSAEEGFLCSRQVFPLCRRIPMPETGSSAAPEIGPGQRVPGAASVRSRRQPGGGHAGMQACRHASR